MAISIELIKSEVVPNGKYQILTATYKTPDGKQDAKKLMSFDANTKDVYKVLSQAQPGDCFSVTSEKVGDYWKWTAISTAGKAVAGPSGGRTNTVSRTYETPEERAARQTYIVRQSSIASAIELLKDPKKAASVDDVIATARQFESYVFESDTPPAVAYFTEQELKDPVVS